MPSWLTWEKAAQQLKQWRDKVLVPPDGNGDGNGSLKPPFETSPGEQPGDRL